MPKTVIIKKRELGTKNLKVSINSYGQAEIQQLDDFNDFVVASIQISVPQLEELIAEIKKV
jgi:hypothetical protein